MTFGCAGNSMVKRSSLLTYWTYSWAKTGTEIKEIKRIKSAEPMDRRGMMSAPLITYSNSPTVANAGGLDKNARMMRLTTALALAAIFPASSLSAQTAPLVIRAATVIDGKGGTLSNVQLVIQGSKILRIEPAKASATYDLSTQTVMPGLIDTHTHIVDHFDRKTGRLHTANDPETPEQTTLYAYENAYKTFMAGFTTIQSPGKPIDK